MASANSYRGYMAHESRFKLMYHRLPCYTFLITNGTDLSYMLNSILDNKIFVAVLRAILWFLYAYIYVYHRYLKTTVAQRRKIIKRYIQYNKM